MLSKEQRDHIEHRLRREREDALEAVKRFDENRQSLEEKSGELSVHRFHMADVATESMEREKEFLLRSKEGRLLYDIDAALQRLYSDPEQFGQCERCGKTISPERLDVVPWTPHCADCQRELEAAEGAAS